MKNILDKDNNIIRQRLKPQSDKFRKERGGSGEFLDLYCSTCESYIATYQKDGSGNLFRLYVDRIISPYLIYTGPFDNIKEMPKLTCPNPKCSILIGIPMLYLKEKRLAYRIVTSIHKTKNYKGIYPPLTLSFDQLFLES